MLSQVCAYSKRMLPTPLPWDHRPNAVKWTYDLIDHMMVNLDAIIALGPMTSVLGFDVELHPMNEKIFNNLLIGKWKYIVYVKKAYLFQELYFIYLVETFIGLNWKA